MGNLRAHLPARRAQLALDEPPATCLDLLVRSRSDVINYTELGLHQRLHQSARVRAICLALMRWLRLPKKCKEGKREIHVTQMWHKIQHQNAKSLTAKGAEYPFICTLSLKPAIKGRIVPHCSFEVFVAPLFSDQKVCNTRIVFHSLHFLPRGMSSHKFHLHISVVCQGISICAKIAVIIGKIISPTAATSAIFSVLLQQCFYLPTAFAPNIINSNWKVL